MHQIYTTVFDFSISEKLVLKTFDPNSNLIDTDFFYNSGETILNLAEHKKTPSPGQYLLKVYNKDNSEVSQETFTFDGPNLNILSCDQKWWQNQGNFYLIGLSTIVQNTGDMPVYPAYITIEFDDESITGSILPSSIMPGSVSYTHLTLPTN